MKKQRFNCPAEMTLRLVGGKWKIILIYNLRKGAKRFGELKRLSPGISVTMLTKELRELESSGLIERAQIGRDKLEGVEYGLSRKGESLKPLLNAMIRWGLQHRDDHVIGDFGMAGF